MERPTEKETGMTLIPIRTTGFEHLPILRELYETSFQESQRRSFDKLVTMLEQPAMFLHALMVAKRVAGLAVHWELGNFLFLEHLTIMSAYRGLGYGKAYMERLLQEQQRQVVLEVERPTSDLNRKRIEFYEQLGFTLHQDFDYLQPPYERNGQPVPLYLMAAPAFASVEACERAAMLLQEQVYERFY